MAAVVVVIAWYASGFLVAWWLVDRGHSPVVWWSVAALLGGLTVLPAVVARASIGRAEAVLDVVARPDRPTDGLRLAVIGPTDRLRGALDTVPPPVAGRTGSVTLVGLVGHEAFASGVDTGERAAAATDLCEVVRPHARTDTRVVTTVGGDRLDAVIEAAGTPDLLVAATGRRTGALRRSFRQHLEISARLDVPLLFAPVGASDDTHASWAGRSPMDVVA